MVALMISALASGSSSSGSSLGRGHIVVLSWKVLYSHSTGEGNAGGNNPAMD